MELSRSPTILLAPTSPNKQREARSPAKGAATLTSEVFPKTESLGKSKKTLKETTKVSLILLFPMLMLLGMTVNALIISMRSLKTTQDTMLSINYSLDVAELVRHLQIERGRTAMFLSSNRSNMVVFDNLLEARDNTDFATQMVRDWSFINIDLLRNYSGPVPLAFMKHLGKFRNLADIGQVATDESNHFYTDLNAQLLAILFKDVTAPSEYRYIVALDHLGRAAEESGIMRAIGAAFWIPCIADNRIWMLQTYTKHKCLMETAFIYYAPLKMAYQRALGEHGLLLKDIDDMVYYLVAPAMTADCRNQTKEWRLEMGLKWFSNMTTFINMLSMVRNLITDRLIDSLSMQIAYNRLQVTIYLCIMMVVTVCAFGTMAIVYRLTSRVQKFANDICSKTNEVADEKRRTERLLYQMMPRTVADQLLRGERVESEFFESVTIYFSDVVGFTSISARSSPAEIIDLLNALYGTFDRILDKYDVYKVETIGDAYMIVSGLPRRNSDRHAPEIALLSLRLLRIVPNIAIAHLPGETLQLRIGLHSGTCAAGVVGIKMPRYCLFGDTVNTASRMESTGEPLKIHISDATLSLLEVAGGFETEVRGTIAVKGKGTMTTHFVLSHISEQQKTSTAHPKQEPVTPS